MTENSNYNRKILGQERSCENREENFLECIQARIILYYLFKN